MKPKYKPTAFPKLNQKVKYLIIHDLHCVYDGIEDARNDTMKSQINKMRSYNWILNGEPDLNYHFVIETINKVPETFMARPLHRKCEYDDIPSAYDYAFHIGLVGDYEILMPNQDFYMQMAYRCITPIMFWFKIPMDHVLTHAEITTNDNNKRCPGNLLNMNKLRSAIQAMRAG